MPAAVIVMILAGSAALAQEDTASSPASATQAPGNASTTTSQSDAVDPIPSPITAPGGLLPGTGSAVRLGSVGQSLTSAGLAGPLQPAARAWTITPSVGLSEEYTDNVEGLGGTGRGWDLVTLLQPGLGIAGETSRLQGDLSYHPEVDIYTHNSGETRVDQNFGGSLKASLVPSLLFLDVRGFGQVTSNGLGANTGAGTSVATRNGATQSTTVSATPYLVHRFGEWGTGELGASIERTTEAAVSGTTSPQSFASPFALPGNQNETSYSAHAAFQTGEAFERYNGAALLYASQTDGSGVLDGASRDTASLDSGYAITHELIGLLRVGWERIRYGGLTPLRIDDALWDFGLRYVFGPNSTIELRYGHHDGLNAASLNMSIAPTARTRLTATYSEALTTQSELLQNQLANADIDALGTPVDHTTGIPLLMGDGLLGQQDNLTRTKALDLGAALIEDRDTLSIGVNLEDSQLVSSSGTPGELGSNRGIFGNLGWSHDLSPTLVLTTTGTYGVRDALGLPAESERVLVASALLRKQLSETLSGQLSYSYNRISTTPSGSGYAANVFLVAISKSF